MKTEDLMRDPTQFVPAWLGEYEPAPGMLDFEEKWKSFHDPKGRLMVCAHRGDFNIYYPENSLEGFLSAVLAGADMLEADLQTTADGQIVIMHDSTLTRTTNITALRCDGQNWMPESDRICDWTLQQIRRLRLVTSNGEVTEYAVPTLRELLTLAKNRVFVTLDKTDCFRWEDVYELVCEYQAFRTVLIPYNYPFERVLEILDRACADAGVTMPFFAGVVVGNGIWSQDKLAESSRFLREHGLAPILRGGYHNIWDVQKLKPIMDPYSKTHRIYAESMGHERDFPETWASMLDMGYSIFMGNRLYDLLRLLKERHFT